MVYPIAGFLRTSDLLRDKRNVPESEVENNTPTKIVYLSKLSSWIRERNKWALPSGSSPQKHIKREVIHSLNPSLLDATKIQQWYLWGFETKLIFHWRFIPWWSQEDWSVSHTPEYNFTSEKTKIEFRYLTSILAHCTFSSSKFGLGDNWNDATDEEADIYVYSSRFIFIFRGDMSCSVFTARTQSFGDEFFHCHPAERWKTWVIYSIKNIFSSCQEEENRYKVDWKL